jgi:hypothetical protein
MMQTELDSSVFSMLQQQGWNGLPQNIENDLADLKDEGFNPPTGFPLRFLQELNNFEFEIIDKENSCKKNVRLGTYLALEIPLLKDKISKHEKIIYKQLYPIGSINLFHLGQSSSYERMILLMSDDGGVYSSRSYFIAQIGNNAYDAINRMISKNELWKSNESLRIEYSKDDPRLEIYAQQHS